MCEGFRNFGSDATGIILGWYGTSLPTSRHSKVRVSYVLTATVECALNQWDQGCIPVRIFSCPPQLLEIIYCRHHKCIPVLHFQNIMCILETRNYYWSLEDGFKRLILSTVNKFMSNWNPGVLHLICRVLDKFSAKLSFKWLFIELLLIPGGWFQAIDSITCWPIYEHGQGLSRIIFQMADYFIESPTWFSQYFRKLRGIITHGEA